MKILIIFSLLEIITYRSVSFNMVGLYGFNVDGLAQLANVQCKHSSNSRSNRCSNGHLRKMIKPF